MNKILDRVNVPLSLLLTMILYLTNDIRIVIVSAFFFAYTITDTKGVD